MVLIIDVCQPAISKINVFVTVVLNVLTDLYLISIPLPVSPNMNLVYCAQLVVY